MSLKNHVIKGVLVSANREKKVTTAQKATGPYKSLKYLKIVSYPIFNAIFSLDQLKVGRFFLYWSDVLSVDVF